MIITITDPMMFEAKLAEAKSDDIILVEDIDKFLQVHDADTVAEMLNGIQLYDKEEYNWIQKCRKSLRGWCNEN